MYDDLALESNSQVKRQEENPLTYIRTVNLTNESSNQIPMTTSNDNGHSPTSAHSRADFTTSYYQPPVQTGNYQGTPRPHHHSLADRISSPTPPGEATLRSYRELFETWRLCRGALRYHRDQQTLPRTLLPYTTQILSIGVDFTPPLTLKSWLEESEEYPQIVQVLREN